MLRLADATGAKVEKLPESIGGLTVDLTDPSGVLVRVVADTHELAALPAQPTQVFNFGHEARAHERAPSARLVSPQRSSDWGTSCCRPRRTSRP